MVLNTHSHTIISPHLLLSILPPSATAHPSSSLKFSRSDSTWLQPWSAPPAECAGGGPRPGTSIFQALSAHGVTWATWSPGETWWWRDRVGGRRLEPKTDRWTVRIWYGRVNDSVGRRRRNIDLNGYRGENDSVHYRKMDERIKGEWKNREGEKGGKRWSNYSALFLDEWPTILSGMFI